MGAICCLGNKSSNPINPKTLCSLSLNLMMLYIKFEKNWPTGLYIQSNFGRSNSPVSNTRDPSNSFVGPSNFPIHLMLKYIPGSNIDGSNSRTQSTVRRAIFSCKNAMMARTKYFFFT